MATTAADRSPARHPWLAAVLSAIVPGAGQLYARRYLRAVAWFLPALAAVAAAVPLASMRTADLIGTALSPTVLWSVFAINVLAALWRLGAAVDAYVVVRQRPGHDGEIALAVGWALIALLIALPHLGVARYTYDTITLVEAVFVTDDAPDRAQPVIPIGTDADIVPDPVVYTYDVEAPHEQSVRNLIFRDGIGDPDAVASWDAIAAERQAPIPGGAPFVGFDERVGGDRITILFAGGDAGPGRGGLRTDAMIVATIDTATGKAALFSFPRNMAQIPLPRRFANAFVELQRRLQPPPPPVEETDDGGEMTEGEEEAPEPPAFVPCKCFPEQLNAIYPYTRRWTRTYPNEVDPGMAALRDVLEHLMGLDIDYYALIDMAAFVDLVDAVGGVDVYVTEPLESEVSPPREGEPWAYVKVEPGWNHLDGPEALAYARARKGSSDYARMERQRCMVKAFASKADAVTILRSFPAIVDAVEGSVVTDIPLTFVPDLITATAGLDLEDIETVGFTHSYWKADRDARGHPVPVLDRIRWKVRQVVGGQSDPESTTTVSSECDA